VSKVTKQYSWSSTRYLGSSEKSVPWRCTR
jgi:hypothetical protein